VYFVFCEEYDLLKQNVELKIETKRRGESLSVESHAPWRATLRGVKHHEGSHASWKVTLRGKSRSVESHTPWSDTLRGKSRSVESKHDRIPVYGTSATRVFLAEVGHF
jgi:hypothetical protein